MKLYRCTVCGSKKQHTEFYLRANGRPGEYKCKSCILKKRKVHYKENYEQVRESNRKAVSAWQKRNLHYGAEKTMRYAANRKKAVPCWVDREELSKIRSLYKKARQISKQTGMRHEVDHAIPLNSEKVCGLHTIANLQIMPKSENLRKGNRLPEDIVCTDGKPSEPT